MKVIGLTGGIGSGKTFVASIFEELGVPVYNSDIEAKLLMNTSKEIQSELIELLGKDSYSEGKLNRSYIAEKVFNDKGLLQQLNAIVHPAVKDHFAAWALDQNSKYVIQESALIFENNNQDHYDAIILVTAPTEIRIQRVMNRDNTSREQIIAIMKNQFGDSQKLENVDFVIDNIEKDKVYTAIECIHNKFSS